MLYGAMAYPLVSGADGVKIRPELMETEVLYHCIFKEKAMLAYKDGQEVLHCYEVEEKELVERIRGCGDGGLERIIDEYVAKQAQD